MTRPITSFVSLSLLALATLTACGGGEGSAVATNQSTSQISANGTATSAPGTATGTASDSDTSSTATATSAAATTATATATTATTVTTVVTPTVPAGSVPGAPTLTAVTAGSTLAVVAFTTPMATSGTTITGYIASCSAGGVAKTGTGTASPIIVLGLTNGAAYTCTVAASNAAGTSAVSAVLVVTPLASNPTALAAGYKQAKWASNLSVTYPTECSMTIATNGQPNHAIDSFYLEPPIGSYTTVVAKAAVSGMALVVVPYTAGTRTSFMTFNTCPTKAATTTPTSGGAIGLMISGPTLFNATEGENGKAAALSDNVSYSFKDSIGTARTAYFIDSCNGHPTPSLSGNEYHYHGLSSCVTAQVDTAGGPSHLIGVAADGFPIYGNKDISGNTVTVDQLDACNGITSATPEFPGGVYHYVLPAGVTNFQSSLRCYSGTVTARQVLAMQSMGICKVPLTASAALSVLPGKSTLPGTRQRAVRLAV